MRLIRLIIAIIVLILTLAAAAAQESEWPAVKNLRFTDYAGSFSWDSPAKEVRGFSIDLNVRENGRFVDRRFYHVGSGELSSQIRPFEAGKAWRVRVRANYADGDFRTRFGDWSKWVYLYPPTPTPKPTDTPSASYRQSFYENRSVYDEESCADRREFRRCRQTCLRSDPTNCWDLTCGPWQVGVAAPRSCPTPEGAPTPTATVAPSGSVKCENKVINGDNGFSCAFTLHNSRVAYQAVGWMDQPDVERPMFGYREGEDGTLSLRVLPEECGKTFEGRAIAFAFTPKYLATVDFTHKAICSLSTDTPVPTATADTAMTATAEADMTATAEPDMTATSDAIMTLTSEGFMTATPPPRDTDPPPREPTECPEVCSASSGVWSVYDDRRIEDENACRIERYERRLQQYTCTNCGSQTRQYNKVVEDWKFVSSHSC